MLILNPMYAYANLDINYKADIKGGLNVLHPAVGVVISGQAIIGKNLILTGGNVIGCKKKTVPGDFIIGDNCNLGANAVIMGPVKLGNNISVGASACVTKNCLTDNVILVGVPAKPVNRI